MIMTSFVRRDRIVPPSFQILIISASQSFAPAGAKRNGNPFFPAACTSEKTLYGLQVWNFGPSGQNYARSQAASYSGKACLSRSAYGAK